MSNIKSYLGTRVHDITEIILEVALNTIIPTHHPFQFTFYQFKLYSEIVT
jgi:hypothetical protein